MKIDRIRGIIIYFFNHDKVAAKTLAEKYDVSVRTIQCDNKTGIRYASASRLAHKILIELPLLVKSLFIKDN